MYDVNIEYLYEAARLGTMHAAAQLLTISTSSISRQISQLETEIGAAVIEHGSRRVRLTDAGQLLVDYYKAQLSQREAFEARLTDLKGLRSGRICLAVAEGCVGSPLSAALCGFGSRHPGLQLDVRVLGSSAEVERSVVEDEAHLGLVFFARGDPRIRVLASVNMPLYAVMAPSHPLAHRVAVTFAELTQHPLCLLPEACFGTRRLLERSVPEADSTRQPSVTSNSIALLKALLRGGALYTLLPPLSVADELDRGELSIVPLAGAVSHEASVHVVARLGRQLLPPPLAAIPVLKACLDSYAARFRSGAHGSYGVAQGQTSRRSSTGAAPRVEPLSGRGSRR